MRYQVYLGLNLVKEVEASNYWEAKSIVANYLREQEGYEGSLTDINRALKVRNLELGPYSRPGEEYYKHIEAAGEGVCPYCGVFGVLVKHHWSGWRKSEYLTKKDSEFKLMCHSCNGLLGKKYKGEYPNWEEQETYLRSIYPELVAACAT